jgi:hypothetical protein
MRMQHKLVAAVAAVTVAVGAAVAGIADATTGPQPHTLVNVVITDNTIKLSKNKTADVTFVDFYIHNEGKLPHTMAIGREESVAVKAGERVHFYVGFPVYGWYRYKVKLNGKPSQRGRFHIDAPQPPD